MKNTRQQRFKKGAASMYVVVFAMMLVAIIMLGFMRLMLSEARRTTDSNLSESAYDSATAGVEDAKVLILKYLQCKKDPSKSGCSRILSLLDSSDFNCNEVIKGLYNSDDKEMLIGTTGGRSTNSSIDEMLDQAYTCVDISMDGDYEGELSPDTSSVVIPVRTYDNSRVKYIQIQWYTNEDMEKIGYTGGSIPAGYSTSLNGSSQNLTNPSMSNIGRMFNNVTLPPTVIAEVFQTAPTYNRQSFYSSTSEGTNRATITLVPSTGSTTPSQSLRLETGLGSDAQVVTKEALIASASKSPNYPVTIHCQSVSPSFSTNYACTAYLEVPNALDNNRAASSAKGADTMFLRFSYPLSSPDQVSYHVSLFDEAFNEVKFSGVQPIVDSTGRANDLFRRVEARLKVGITPSIDPPAELTITGSASGNGIDKTFSVTKNCYNSDRIDPSSGQPNAICDDAQQ